MSAGGSRAVGIYDGDAMVAAYVLRAERFPHGCELLVQAASGRVPGVSLLDTIYPHIQQIAIDSGCGSLRFQTSRKGMAPAMERHGFRECDRVYRKVLL